MKNIKKHIKKIRRSNCWFYISNRNKKTHNYYNSNLGENNGKK